MKQTPDEKSIQQKMQPGNLTLKGFLGNDQRHYHEIIAEDLKKLSQLGITKEQVADKLQELTEMAYENFEGLAEPEPGISVEYISVRGKVLSPFSGQKPAHKGVIHYHDSIRNLSFCWTPLNIKMIRDYGFFEGKGSDNRLDPEIIYLAFFKD
ncbi:MAG: hypothetical protein K9N06_02500 [Candidatus Cloacimonetes bacterium]|nr:hypothetical protein [Candidatus Cloacimonadota bacterium]